MRMNIQSRTKQNLPTSPTLKTKSPLAKSFKAIHHPPLARDPGSSEVQELLSSRTENEIPNRCGPGVKKQKVNTPHPSLDSTSVKTEINIKLKSPSCLEMSRIPPSGNYRISCGKDCSWTDLLLNCACMFAGGSHSLAAELLLLNTRDKES